MTNEAVHFYNQLWKRKLLKKALAEESAMVSADSLEVLEAIERLPDEFVEECLMEIRHGDTRRSTRQSSEQGWRDDALRREWPVLLRQRRSNVARLHDPAGYPCVWISLTDLDRAPSR